jgi:hypothetical protein
MNDYENPWLYDGQPFDGDQIDGYQGFVYLIENPSTNKKYIGKKFFWSAATRQVKGKKKRYKKESDWKSYYGSNDYLKQDLTEAANYQDTKRTILRLCKTKGECSYYEIKEQLAVDALLSDEYYNAFVGCKIHRKHLP